MLSNENKHKSVLEAFAAVAECKSRRKMFVEKRWNVFIEINKIGLAITSIFSPNLVFTVWQTNF